MHEGRAADHMFSDGLISVTARVKMAGRAADPLSRSCASESSMALTSATVSLEEFSGTEIYFRSTSTSTSVKSPDTLPTLVCAPAAAPPAARCGDL